MGRLRVRCALLGAVIVALPASAAAHADDAMLGFSAPPRVPAQARTLVKYIASGSIDVASAVAGTRDLAGGLAVDPSGNLYVAVNNASRSAEVAVLSPDGRLVRRWDPTGGLSVGNPTLLAIGPDGLVYVRNRNERVIRVFTTTGTPVRTFGGSLSPNNTGDLEVDSAGNVYTIDLDRIVKFNTAGAVVGQFTPIPGIHADRLLGLAVAPDGSLYVTVDPFLTGLPEQPPFLVHIDAAGRRLPDPAPLLHRLMGASETHGYDARDIDFANGRLYIAGETRTTALGVITPNAELVDVIGGGSGQQVAIRGERVHVTGLRAQRALNQNPELSIGELDGQFVEIPDGTDVQSYPHSENCRNAEEGNISSFPAVTNITLPRQQDRDCKFVFQNLGSPCPPNSRPTPVEVFSGGKKTDVQIRVDRSHPKGIFTQFEISVDPTLIENVPTGDVVLHWKCDYRNGTIEDRYEWKGRISSLIDPSGNVLDAGTGRPVEAATVRLQFSPSRTGPFGVPAAAAHSPQVNPQVTGTSGAFGWDVAPGFWRLRITAFGYRPLTSPVYSVPPPVTGLKLKLRADPAQQARLIDPYSGRVGRLRLGARLGKVRRQAGLRLRVAGGRVRTISVLAGRYRTARGIRRGSRDTQFFDAYPTSVRKLAGSTARQPVSVRVGKATFSVRRGRIVGITLGR